MPRAIPYPIGLDIVERHQDGHSLAAIAHDLQLSYRSVRTPWRNTCARVRWNDLPPALALCGKTL
jgi:hypothetical protein